ncbi:MAG: cytochrome c [Pseudomonadales bacterium]|nr:cytochrome c [Pseudomonadales bacterium]
MRYFSTSLLLAACGLFLFNAQESRAQSATVLDGIYNTQQATRGKRAYARYCEECHLSDLEGGALEPPLVSVLFLDAWREDYLWSLYDFIATRMPKSDDYRPGSLKPQEYLDILTYILQRNDFPAGRDALSEDALHQVLLVSHDGPMPLPPNATVRAVGCLQPDGGGYRLEQAASPSRVRTSDETDEVELGRSATQELGDVTLALNNLDVLTTSKPLADLTGRKVQAKGVLNSLGEPNARLFVLSLEDLGSCNP